MDGFQVNITGLKELNEKLAALRNDLAVRAMRMASRQAGKVFQEGMKALAPRGRGRLQETKKGEQRVHLADDIKVRVKVDKSTGDATVTVGPSKRTAYIANFLEFGTGSHLIMAKKGGSLFIPGVGFVKHIQHPGSAAHPFMRPAFDSLWERAVSVFKETLANRIERLAARGR